MARYKGIGMPKAKKARVEQAEKIEFEQIEDAIEEEAVGSEREAEQEQQPRAPRRMLHRQQLLQQVREAAATEKETQKAEKARAKSFRETKEVTAKLYMLYSFHKQAPEARVPLEISEGLQKCLEIEKDMHVWMLQSQLAHAEAKLAVRDAQIAVKEASIRDLRARVPKRNRA